MLPEKHTNGTASVAHARRTHVFGRHREERVALRHRSEDGLVDALAGQRRDDVQVDALRRELASEQLRLRRRAVVVESHRRKNLRSVFKLHHRGGREGRDLLQHVLGGRARRRFVVKHKGDELAFGGIFDGAEVEAGELARSHCKQRRAESVHI